MDSAFYVADVVAAIGQAGGARFAIFDGFAVGVALTMYVPGDAAATTANVVENARMVRLGVVFDGVNKAVLVFLALTLYSLLKHVHRGAARVMVVLVAIAAAICTLNAGFHV